MSPPVARGERWLHVPRIALVTSIDGAAVLALVADRPSVALADGQTLVQAGQAHAALFVLETGALSVEVGGRRIAMISDPGSVVGELGLLLDQPASADVVAVGEAVVRRIENAEQLFDEVPEFARFVATTVAGRLYRIVGFLDDLQAQFGSERGTLGVVPQVLQQLLGAPVEAIDPGSEREPEAPY